jgi:hypothetical protein
MIGRSTRAIRSARHFRDCYALSERPSRRYRLFRARWTIAQERSNGSGRGKPGRNTRSHKIAVRRDLSIPRISAGARPRLPFSWIGSDP